jgi:putative tryptophan/tyrosine transport system substrate-binding protein
MNCREFITLLGGMAGTWPFAVRAQQSGQMRRLGVLMSVVENDPGGVAEVADLRQGLAELGWVTDRNINIDFRWPGGDLDRAKALAKELVDLKPEVLLARSTPTTAALKRESDSIPIVFVNVTEPVEQGFVQSLAQPGGNITGFTNFESMVGGKWLQLLKEVDPRITRVAIIFNPQTAPFAGLFLRSVEAAAPGLAVEFSVMPVRSEVDIEAAMTAFARRPAGGLVAIPDSFTGQHRDLIIATAARNRLPALYANLVSTPSGGLMAYAVDTRDLMHRAAGYVDRILKGSKPAEMPVQQPAKFELSINLKTARALGLTVPQSLLTIADEVIE